MFVFWCGRALVVVMFFRCIFIVVLFFDRR
jgi:hypothetical protein